MIWPIIVEWKVARESRGGIRYIGRVSCGRGVKLLKSPRLCFRHRSIISSASSMSIASGARRGWGGQGFGRPGWWRQDWPEAEIHFAQGSAAHPHRHGRRSSFTADRRSHLRLPMVVRDSSRLLGPLGSRSQSLARLPARGGLPCRRRLLWTRRLVGLPRDHERVLPDRPILDVEDSHALTNVLYTIRDRTFIPGLRHLRAGRRRNCSDPTSGDASVLARHLRR